MKGLSDEKFGRAYQKGKGMCRHALWDIVYIKYTFLLKSLVLNEVFCPATNPSFFHVRGFKKFVKKWFCCCFVHKEAGLIYCYFQPHA